MTKVEDGSVPRISVIIPYYKNEEYLHECLKRCLELDYPDFEIILASEHKISLSQNKQIKTVTGGASQGEKKNAAIAAATGLICAFIDDDAFPSRDWLKNAASYFVDASVGAVCGPGVTPPNDSVMQKASGIIYSSVLGGGPFRYRYTPTREMVIAEAPGYNLLASRQLLLDIGGFATKVRSGEDTLLSQAVRAKGKKIVYSPRVVVYHHRRPLFRHHLRQVYNYALHRGYFAKRIGGLSRAIFYLLPLLLLCSMVALTFAILVNARVTLLTLGLLAIYVLACLGTTLYSSRNMKLGGIAFLGMILTHLCYAAGFARGLLISEIGERPGR